MTQERADEIFRAAQRALPWSDGLRRNMTASEDAEVMDMWLTMPCDTCYVDAFLRFLNAK